MFEQVGNEVAERVRIVLRLGNAPKRAQAPCEVKDIDGLIERGRALGRNGRRAPCRDHETPTCQVRPGTQAADHGQQVGDALAEQRLAQDQRRPGIVLFVIVLAAMARGASAELGRGVAQAAQVGRAGHAALLREPAG